MKVKITIEKNRQASALNSVKYSVPVKTILAGVSEKQKLLKAPEQEVDVRLAYVSGIFK